ncbi:conserved hypothetical protein; putative membrane protein [Bradyrhizobium sp. ORS 285]|uniref:DUF1656 domain-containing protein n=1 Tax=Bradyrhizobium sp. ORS 285 TaxID=115808 RepID=UPI000240780B|nr:DUF1656 domain-containing protein [Bradyrhizobium sp. ORS 285]CCD83789.1 conserved hypothetical protein; putative membrane protein [Bradyrhizobium sp. ORS 285]SMX59332.1 conserved hypothetical protein; putative membrane protein [Bradyrhizobium sp. ORS 285]
MRHDIDIAGLLVPSLLLWLVVAYGCVALLSAGLRRIGFYRLVWHRALFDFALFVCVLGGIVYLASEFSS